MANKGNGIAATRPMIAAKEKLLIIIPAYNEEKNIGQVIDNIRSSITEADIVVVNDGSIDGTEEKASAKNVFILNHAINLGIGASFETGCCFAVANNYHYIVRIDADGQHDARFIKNMLAPLYNQEVDITIGSRFLGESEFTSSFLRLIGIKVIAHFLTIVTGKKITDPTSGFCAMNYKAFDFFSKNCSDDYPEPEILIYNKNFEIKEIPISISKRVWGSSTITPLKSLYYMIKVFFSLLVRFFRKEQQ